MVRVIRPDLRPISHPPNTGDSMGQHSCQETVGTVLAAETVELRSTGQPGAAVPTWIVPNDAVFPHLAHI